MTADAGDDGPTEVDPFQLESRLTSHAIYVTELSGDVAEGFDLTYQSIDVENGVLRNRELGRVINVFRDLLEGEATAVRATVTDLDDRPVARWHCEASWLAALEAGELSEVEFSQRVVDTAEPLVGGGDGGAEGSTSGSGGDGGADGSGSDDE